MTTTPHPVRRAALAALALAFLALPAVPAAAQAPGDPLATLRPGHPRLLLTPERLDELDRQSQTDERLQRVLAFNQARADEILDLPTVEYGLDERGVMLWKSRAVLEHVTKSALAYHFTGEPKYRDRAVAELLSAAAFPDWNRKHFLDLAEMTTAFALGYDWLYDALTEDERAVIRAAIVEKGLREGGLAAYDVGAWWINAFPNNWTQVGNGGMILGALAVAEDEPALATRIVREAVASLPAGLEPYAPAGAFGEGPSYWVYAMDYTAFALGGLDTALGTDFGLGEAPGLSFTGAFRMHTLGPTRYYFNWGDGGTVGTPTPSSLWLARRYDDPALARFHNAWLDDWLAAGGVLEDQQYGAKPPIYAALEIVWYTPVPDGAPEAPLDAGIAGGGDVVTFRSAWDEPEALFVGFRAGDNDANHAHLDAGSFVFDALGVRWAVDLGSGRYSLPDYFTLTRPLDVAPRWTYYRTATRSHNTLTIGGANQRADGGDGRVTRYLSTPARAHAVADLSAAYAGQAERVRRGVALLDRAQLLVQDEVVGARDRVRWALVTEADVTLDGHAATLRQDGEALLVEVLRPAGARLGLASTDPGDPRQNPNEGTSMLTLHVPPGADGTVQIAVRLVPLAGPVPAAPPLIPLDDWRGAPLAETAQTP